MNKLNNFTKRFLFLVLAFVVLAMPSTALAQTNPPDTFNGDQVVIGNSYILREGQTLNGNLAIIGGSAQIEQGAKINGDIALLGGSLNLGGEVSGNVTAAGAIVNFLDGAVIRGDFLSAGATTSNMSRVKVYGSTETMSPRAFQFNFDDLDFGRVDARPNGSGFFNLITGFFSRMLQIFAVAVLALVLALIMPKPLDRVAQSMTQQPMLAGGLGILTLFVAPLVLVILTITIILIPATIISLIAIGAALLLGWIAAGFEIGRRMAVLFKTEWADAVSAGLGTLVLGLGIYLLGFVFCLGGVVSIVISCLGLGGVILSRFGTQTYTPAAAPERTVNTTPARVSPVITEPTPGTTGESAAGTEDSEPKS